MSYRKIDSAISPLCSCGATSTWKWYKNGTQCGKCFKKERYASISDRHRARQNSKYANDPAFRERVKARSTAWRRANPERFKSKMRQLNVERGATYRATNKANKQAYYERNRELYQSYGAKRRAILIRACPAWLTPEQEQQIRDFYRNRPAGYHIDHIVPLSARKPGSRERIASGLHVPWNLQYLPSADNFSKGSQYA